MPPGRRLRTFGHDPERAQRLIDAFDALGRLGRRLEQRADDLLHLLRDDDRSRRRQSLQAGGDVGRQAVDLVLIEVDEDKAFVHGGPRLEPLGARCVDLGGQRTELPDDVEPRRVRPARRRSRAVSVTRTPQVRRRRRSARCGRGSARRSPHGTRPGSASPGCGSARARGAPTIRSNPRGRSRATTGGEARRRTRVRRPRSAAASRLEASAARTSSARS